MEIRDLRYLAAAASAGNFGRAAKFLGVETSTISRHIARVEDELGLAFVDFRRELTRVFH
jgi:DNA-binding transcriptional LysR family regulator